MSAEKIIEVKQNSSTLTIPKTNNEKHSGRVDINHLLDRVRKEKEEQNNTKVTIFIFFLAFVVVAGAILTF